MYWFALGREFKLSLAEIFSFFPRAFLVFESKDVLILDRIEKDKLNDFFQKNGGTIKVFSLQEYNSQTQISEIITEKLWWSEGKINFALNIFSEENINQKKILLSVKERFKEMGKNARFINKDFKNISSAHIIGEKLIAKKSDINIVFAWKNNSKIFIGETIWVQDINAYTKRDFGKKRDMDTGMLPPKLAQMMINIANNGKQEITSLYDPFCWLGTILIEALLMDIKKLFASDINQAMGEITKENLDFIKKEFHKTNFRSQVFTLDAQEIQKVDFLDSVECIVSEWYLGQIFTHKSIDAEKIQAERKKLATLYESFFHWLKKRNFKGTIVMSFPFWEFKRKYIYFTEIYTLLEKYTKKERLLSHSQIFRETKSWSLLYKRSNQLVGREIFKIYIKW